MAEAKIDVRINASDLEALRALAERMERAAQQTEVLTSLRLPIPPGACRACELKDRTLDHERTSHERTKFELDAWRKDHARREQEIESLKRSIATQSEALQAERKDRETLAAALESERAAHAVTRESLKATTRKEARLEQDCEALKKVNDDALAELRRMRGTLERSSAEHFATRVRLRDVLREAAAYAKEAADYAVNRDEWEPESEYAKVAREDAAQYEAESAALGLGLDTFTLPPAAGETIASAQAATGAHVDVTVGIAPPSLARDAMDQVVRALEEFGVGNGGKPSAPAPAPTSRELGASKLRVREITPDASIAFEMARLLDEQVFGHAESKDAPAPAARAPFRAGDIVNHRKSGENWLLACDEFDGYVMPSGWPESAEPANSCDLVKAATDEERVAMLEEVSKSKGLRAARAKAQLDAIAQAAPTPAQPAPAATFRRRFLAGDRVRPAAQEAVYSAVLDEDDSGNVAIQIGSRRYVNVGADALELVKPADPAKRNLELAFHFHLWHTSVEPNIMDSVPEFARIAAQQLLRDPWNECVVKGSDAVPYGQVRVTGGAK